MADPVTAWAATGAAASVVQIIEFTVKLVKETYRLMESSDIALEENKQIEALTLMHSSLAERVLYATNEKRPIQEAEQAIENLARECKNASKDLLKQLSEFKITQGSKGPKRAWQSASRVKRALQKRQYIEQRRKYLSELNGQLSTALLMHFKYNQLAGLNDIFTKLSDAETKNAEMVVESREIILNALETHQDRDKCTRIIDSLRFPEMQLRRSAIPEACHNTFNWLFKDSSRFSSWLESEESIFWVTGKAGSGKSTLMKFLAAHQVTKQLLRTWSGSAKLIIAQNYMWHPEFAMQRNEQGMLQTILFQILQSEPRLVKYAAQKRWNSDIVYLERPDPWFREELLQVLEEAFQQTKQTHRYCLFIDGLDEYEGEHHRLINTIMALARYSNVKICLSSRSWNVFRNAFEHLENKLYLHELTKGDISTYIDKELGQMLKGSSIAGELISSIIDKARGVFLWVFLVVRSLREGLQEGDSVALMRQRVDEFPSDLDSYFGHILSRVPKTYKRLTSQALKLATLTLKDDILHPVLGSASFTSFWLLSQEHLGNPRFALDLEFREVDDAVIDAMYGETKQFLNKCCKDFLCSAPAIQDIDSNRIPGRFEFLHRTVYDFLETESMRGVIAENIPAHFKERAFSSHLVLARSKFIPAERDRLCEFVTEVMVEGTKCLESGDQAHEVLEEYERTAIRYLEVACPPNCRFHNCLLMETDRLRRLARCFTSVPLHSFVTEVIRRYPRFVENMEKHARAFLEPALGLYSKRPFPIPNIRISFVELLLQHGAAMDQKRTPVFHQYLIKAASEKESWTESNREFAAKVAEMLVSYGADLQADVFLPADIRLFGYDGSDRLYSPLRILRALFNERQVNKIVELIEPSTNVINIDTNYEQMEM